MLAQASTTELGNVALIAGRAVEVDLAVVAGRGFACIGDPLVEGQIALVDGRHRALVHDRGAGSRAWQLLDSDVVESSSVPAGTGTPAETSTAIVEHVVERDRRSAGGNARLAEVEDGAVELFEDRTEVRFEVSCRRATWWRRAA